MEIKTPNLGALRALFFDKNIAMPQLCYGYGLGGQNALGVWLFGGCAFSEIILTVEIKTLI